MLVSTKIDTDSVLQKALFGYGRTVPFGVDRAYERAYDFGVSASMPKRPLPCAESGCETVFALRPTGFVLRPTGKEKAEESVKRLCRRESRDEAPTSTV